METPFPKHSLPSRVSKSRNTATVSKGPINLACHDNIDTHPQRLLLSVARQSGIGDPQSCSIIMSILAAGRAIRRALLGFQDNSGAHFATLLTLYALDPLPATAADLAYHAEVSGSSITEVIEALERRGLIAWDAEGRGQITPIYLTELGHQVAVRAVRSFLQVASTLAGDIGAPNGNATVETCRHIERYAPNYPNG
jgi:DNA-binding MarR family transcriptional regulator